MIEMIGFTSIGEPHWIGGCAYKRAAAVGHFNQVLSHLKRPEQNWTGISVDATAGESSVDMYGCITYRRFIGKQRTLEDGIPPSHSGHAAQANARVEVMPAIRAAG